MLFKRINSLITFHAMERTVAITGFTELPFCSMPRNWHFFLRQFEKCFLKNILLSLKSHKLWFHINNIIKLWNQSFWRRRWCRTRFATAVIKIQMCMPNVDGRLVLGRHEEKQTTHFVSYICLLRCKAPDEISCHEEEEAIFLGSGFSRDPVPLN